MADPPLAKPDHLRASDSPWLVQNVASLAALGLGLLGFVVVAVTQSQLWATPDWRISVPPFVATAVAAAIAASRRERGYPMWLIGLGFASAALVLGWFLMLAIVIAVTAVAILVLHAVM